MGQEKLGYFLLACPQLVPLRNLAALKLPIGTVVSSVQSVEFEVCIKFQGQPKTMKLVGTASTHTHTHTHQARRVNTSVCCLFLHSPSSLIVVYTCLTVPLIPHLLTSPSLSGRFRLWPVSCVVRERRKR